MPKVHKSITEAKEHLRSAAPMIPERYKAGTSRADWAGPASSPQAKANFEAGIAEAIAKDSRGAGIVEAGDAGYRKGCAEKGAPVIGTRILAAIEKYAAGFTPILSAMSGAADAAPARTRDWRANVNNRLLPVVEAARKAAGKE